MTPSPAFIWHASHLGGGGYITGFVQDAVNPNLLYARCDVAGVFKSEDRGATWRPVNRGMTACHHHSVQSLALSPHRPNVLFRCSGEARGHTSFGDIHKSTDYGESWFPVFGGADYYGNGPTRFHGELVAFDPMRADFVMAGSYSQGVWMSTDEGETWTHAGLRGARIINVVPHPAVAGHVYVSTMADASMEFRGPELISRLHDVPREGAGRLYLSSDWGQSWELLVEGYDFTALVFDPRDPRHLFAATKRHGIFRSQDGGRSWQPTDAGLPRAMYNTLASGSGSGDPPVLYTAPDNRGSRTEAGPMPIFRSEDGGESWRLIRHHTTEDFRNYPAYMSPWHAGWAVSRILVDCEQPERLYVSNWYGVAVSDDGGLTWDAHQFRGTETICAEDILCDTTRSGRAIFTLADHPAALSEDNGRSYRTFAAVPEANASTALVASRHRPDLMLEGLTRRESRRRVSCLARTFDAGQTVETVHVLPPGLFVQALAEDPHRPGCFFALIEGALDDGAGLYRSDDWGETWRNLRMPLPAHIKTLPHDRDWIEAELLSVVVYQVKNACGTNKRLVVDPWQEGLVYLGEPTEGLFAVTADGQSLRHIGQPLPDVGQPLPDAGQGLPFGRDRASVLNVIKADPARPGTLYAGFIREGLWRTRDYGGRWDKVYPSENVIFNASAVAIGGPSGQEIVIASEPLYWSRAPSAVVFSPDLGETWVDVTDPSLGAIRWKGIALEEKTGALHGVACGNGCFYAERHSVKGSGRG